MFIDTQDAFNTPPMLKDLRADPVLSDVIPNGSQLFASAEPIQIQTHIHRSDPIVFTTYPESAYQWLVEVLDGLIDFGNQHGHYGVINLTEDEYEWLDNVLEELVYSVGDNENHPLTPLMELVIRLINDYEDNYVPKLTEQSPKLAEKETFETGTEDDRAAYAFFSIGFLLYQGKRIEKALFAYSNAITLKHNFWEVLYNRGITCNSLNQYEKALIDFNEVIELNPDFPDAYYSRGITLFNLDQHDKAKDDFNKAIELDTKFVDAYYNRGVMNLESGNYSEAFADFNKAQFS